MSPKIKSFELSYQIILGKNKYHNSQKSLTNKYNPIKQKIFNFIRITLQNRTNII